MIRAISIINLYVLDQDSAKEFYVTKLGFELRSDDRVGDFRWLVVGPPGADYGYALMEPGAPQHDAATERTLRELIAKGTFSGGVLVTDDCRREYAELSAKGVEFLAEPAERPYGIEALFRDDSGNWFSLGQPNAELDADKPWDDCVSEQAGEDRHAPVQR
ncbi:VOC family protein [Sciscionella marina]|uniref:VOC family protein n=1 Tax=Sciscionella marina TaxID=508770 RepID=UPI0003761564|nr:VOC family protein [Sciscionella marina]